MAVVAVQHRSLGNALVCRGRQHREELTLRLEVLLKRAVKIEMLRRKIREDGDVDLCSTKLAQRERVARRFEHAPRPTRDEQFREELLHLDGLLGALTCFV